jgi:flagellar motor switch protein FliG
VLQVDVIRCLADLEDSDGESLKVIERELAAWMQIHHRHPERQGAGLAAVAEILQAADGGGRRRVMNSLQLRDRQLAGRIARSMKVLPGALGSPSSMSPSAAQTQAAGLVAQLEQRSAAARYADRDPNGPISPTFDDLGELDARSLKKLFSCAEAELVLLALAGASDRVVNHVCGQLPEPMAEALRGHLAGLGPMRLSDVAAAQQELAATASRLANEGEIAFAPRRVALTG